MYVVRLIAGVAGFALVVWTAVGAIKTVVLPRAESAFLTRWLFIGLRRLVFDPLASPRRTFAWRDRVMAMYAPVGLLLLPGVWVACTILGFSGIFWATGIQPWTEALVTSGSSLLTLGFVRPEGIGRILVAFVEAGVGLGLVSLMISYLPTIYGAFSRRESLVGMLEVRAGSPPSATELIVRYSRIGRLDMLDDDLFVPWEQWFADIEESHTSQPSLAFFRSPQPERSWITAAGCVLDTAAIMASLVDRPRDARADVLIRAGFISLRRIADFFGIDYDPDPEPGDPIAIERGEFDELCDELTKAGVPLKADRDQAWHEFAGWRVNYDTVLLALCSLVMAPPAMWSGDRTPLRQQRVKLFRKARTTN